MESDRGWIKLHRKLQQSDMYRGLTSKQRDIFTQILLCANYAESEFMFNGELMKLEPGQFVTSLEKLASFCAKDVTIQNIRTCLLILEKWQFLTNKSTNKYRIITICKWSEYQAEVTSKVTINQQTTNKQLTTNKNDKNVNNEKKLNILEKVDDFSNSKELLYWQEKVGTVIRTKHKENIAAAHKLKDMLGHRDFARAVETVRIVRADKYAGKALHMIGNYVQLLKNIELIENYRAGLEERPKFESITTPVKTITSI